MTKKQKEKEPSKPSPWSEKTEVLNVRELLKGHTKEMAYLVVLTGSRMGDMYRIDKDRMTIGRNEDCDVLFEEEGISRIHARLERLGNGGVKIVDLDSTNGTFFEGNRIKERELRDGDKIQVGASIILKFSFQDSFEEHFQRQLFDMATRDALTRVYNRKTFEERFHSEFAYSQRHKSLLSLILMDIDHFKLVNDTYGHQAGDFVLRMLAQLVSDMIRSEDLLARYGGEEFVLLARDADEEKAFLFGTRIRKAVENYEFVFEGRRIPITISAGVATLNKGNFSDSAMMFQEADRQLYKAKEGGRNRVASILTG